MFIRLVAMPNVDIAKSETSRMMADGRKFLFPIHRLFEEIAY